MKRSHWRTAEVSSAAMAEVEEQERDVMKDEAEVMFDLQKSSKICNQKKNAK